jgi:peptide/nickel transport system permease protein
VSVRYHLVRGLIPPTLATLAGKLSYLIGGSVVVEYVFGWQGLAYQVLDSLTTSGPKDYPFILAATMLFVGLSVLLHLTSELVSLASDPRLRTTPVAA